MHELLNLAVAAAKKAGNLVQSRMGKSRIQQKGETYNLVTEADTEAENVISSMILEGDPGSVLLA